MSKRGRTKARKPVGGDVEELEQGFNVCEQKTSLGEESRMYSYTERLATFTNWPFNGVKNATCTAERMAAAGFYVIQHGDDSLTNDHCRCFVCFKELEGFEETDNPWEEHMRNTDCPFINLGKQNPEDVTAEDMIRMFQERLVKIVTESFQTASEVLENTHKQHSKALQQVFRRKL